MSIPVAVSNQGLLGLMSNEEPHLLIRVGLTALTVGALLLRLWNLAAGLPDLPQADEPTLIGLAVRFGTRDLNPHYFQYPTLWPYALSGVFGAYFVSAWSVGLFRSIQDFKVQYFVDPTSLWFLGRLSSAALGAATVPIVYCLGKRLVSRRVGLFAAAGLAVAPLHVQYSHYLVTDVPLTFATLVAFLLLIRLSEDDFARPWLVALVCGLAASVKYSAAPLVGPLIATRLGRLGRSVTVRRVISVSAVAGIWMGIGFVIGTPYAIWDPLAFVTDVRKILSRAWAPYYLGFDPRGSGVARYLLKVLPEGVGLPLAILSVAGFVWMTVEGVLLRRVAWWMMACFIVPYFVIVSSSRTPFARYMLPLLPLAMIYAGFTWDRVAQFVSRPGWQVAMRLGLVAAIFPVSVVASATWVSSLALPDTRRLATEWLKKHAPASSVIVTERYGIPLEESITQMEAQIETLRRLADSDPEAARQLRRSREKHNVLARVDGRRSGFIVYKLEVYEPTAAEAFYKVPYTPAALRAKGARYVVLSSYMHDAFRRFPRLSPQKIQFYEEMERTGRLVFEISPLEPSCRAHPDVLWDMETIDRSCARYSGPAIKIFETTCYSEAARGQAQG